MICGKPLGMRAIQSLLGTLDRPRRLTVFFLRWKGD
jgi:hypothetical protein